LPLFSTALALAGVGPAAWSYSLSHHFCGLEPTWSGKQAWLWLLIGLLALSFFFIVDYQSPDPTRLLFLTDLPADAGLPDPFLGRASSGARRGWFNLGIFYGPAFGMAKLVLILALTALCVRA